MALSISEAAARSGCTPSMIRYYESIGLLDPAARTDTGRRSFGRDEVARLSFIRRTRDFGMAIPQVRELLVAAELPANSCAAARPVVAEHLAAIRAKRAELKALETSLKALLDRCEAACTGNATEDCGFFDDFRLPAVGR